MTGGWVVVRRGVDDTANFYIYPQIQKGCGSLEEARSAAIAEARRCPGIKVYAAQLVEGYVAELPITVISLLDENGEVQS